MPRGAAEGLVPPLVGVQHDLQHLAVVVGELILLSVHRCPAIQPVQTLGNAAQGGIGCLEQLPLLQLDAVLLVHMLRPGEQRVPVVLFAVLLLDKGNGVLQHLRGVGVRPRLVVDHGHGHRKIRQAEPPPLEHGGGFTGVAGHIGGQHRFAHDGEIVVDGHARLRRAAGADVRRQAEGLRHVDMAPDAGRCRR